MALRLRSYPKFASLVTLFLLLAALPLRAGDLSTPVRVEIQPQVREAAVGATIEYAVSLRNAVGEAVAAPKEITIEVQAALPSGQVEKRQVTIAQGASEAGGAVPVSEPGPIPLEARNMELIGGGAVVFGKPGPSATRGMLLPQRVMGTGPSQSLAAAVEPEPVVELEAVFEFEPAMEAEAEVEMGAAGETDVAAEVEAAAEMAAAEEMQAEEEMEAAAEMEAEAAGDREAEIASPGETGATASAGLAPAAPPGNAPAPAPAPAPAAPASGTWSQSLPAPTAVESPAEGGVVRSSAPMPASSSGGTRRIMLYVPENEILADGHDGAVVTAYLDPCPGMAEDVVVRLAATRGRLDPDIVTVRRGECSATTQWVSEWKSLGDATLSVLVSVPHLTPGEKIVRTFVPPIHSLRLTPNPSEINLLNQGDVLAELHDDVNNVPVATDRPMKLTLSLREGNGALRPLELTFDEGDSATRASFQPTYWGKVVVAGQIPFRMEERAEFVVRSGFAAFLISAIGGLIGGFLAYRAKKEKPLRIVIGLITGFALFAFFLLFGVENILEVTGGLNVLNPVSVFLLSLVGGWAGTNVLAWALKQIGVEA